jgi:hypothetical protein
MSTNIYLISADLLKERTGIHTNIDEKILGSTIKVAQDLYIHPLLGTALFNKLKTDIDSTGAPTGVYLTLLRDYVVDTLIWYTLYELPTDISYQYWNKGIVRKQGDNTELPSMNEILDIANKNKNRADHYAERCRLYLLQNEASFSEYVNYGTGVDDVAPARSGFSPSIYLGDVDDDCRNWEEKYLGSKPRC